MITPAAVSEYSDAQVCQSYHSSHITCAVLRSSCLGACVTRVRDEPGGGPPPDPPRWAVHTSSLSLCVTFTTVETLRLPVRGRVLVLLTARGDFPRAVRSTRTRPRTGSLRVSTVVKVTHRERTSAYLHVLQHLSPPVTTCRVHGLRKNQLCRHTAHHTGSDRQKMITPSSSIDIPILCRNYRQVVHRRTYRRNRRY